MVNHYFPIVFETISSINCKLNSWCTTSQNFKSNASSIQLPLDFQTGTRAIILIELATKMCLRHVRNFNVLGFE